MSVQLVPKTAVSVTEMARLLGLSRSRLYQLLDEGVLPAPIYDLMTRRPYFDEDMQARCHEVRRRNCGINGRPVLFYTPRRTALAPTRPARKMIKKTAPTHHADLLNGLRSLGLMTVTTEEVGAAVQQLFPRGIGDEDAGEVIRAVFLCLKRHDPGDNARR
jgi:hypothetical protein